MALEYTVFSRFDVTKKDGTSVKLRIQELRKQDQTALLDLISKWFLPEESFARCSRISTNIAAVEEYMKLIRNTIEITPPLVCYVDSDEDDLEIVGFNIFYISNKDEEINFDIETAEVKIFFHIVHVLEKEYKCKSDLHNREHVDKMMGGAGMAVNPSYRGCGVATQLFKARKPLIQKLQIPVTGVWLTSVASQKAALSAGYQKVAEVDFQELGKLCGVTFPDIPKTLVFCFLWP